MFAPCISTPTDRNWNRIFVSQLSGWCLFNRGNFRNGCPCQQSPRCISSVESGGNRCALRPAPYLRKSGSARWCSGLVPSLRGNRAAFFVQLVDTAAPSKSAKSQPLGKVNRPASGSADDFSASAVCGQFLYPSNEMVTRSCVSQPCFAVILNGEPQSLMKPHREDRPFTVIN